MLKNIVILGAMVFALVLASPSLAQQSAAPKIIITWKAETYAPSDFGGKLLPSVGSTITAYLEVVGASGKPADLSHEIIYWYLNDKLFSNTPGVQKISFRAPEPAGDKLAVRAALPNYGSGDVLKTIQIPIVAPEAVISPSRPGISFSDTSLMFKARPFYFNIADPTRLSFNWSINGRGPDTFNDPTVLNVKLSPDTAAGFLLNILLSVSGGGQSAISNLPTLTFQP